MSTDDVLLHVAVRFDSLAQRDEMRMNGDSGPMYITAYVPRTEKRFFSA